VIKDTRFVGFVWFDGFVWCSSVDRQMCSARTHPTNPTNQTNPTNRQNV